MKKAAVLCANGLGDGLLMMIATNQLEQHGYDVTVYHAQHAALQDLFPNHHMTSYPSLDEFLVTFQSFDLVLIQNDHSDRAWKLFELRKAHLLNNLRFIFPAPYPSQTESKDFVFNPQIPFATNLAKACQELLSSSILSKTNAIAVNPSLQYRKFPKRVVIHPTSQDKKRNWTSCQFLSLALQLKKEGFCPYFAVGVKEREEWECVMKKGFALPQFENLKELMEFIYESGFLIGNDSGLGHLASSVQIPTLTISGNTKRVKLWRPDFALNQIVTPPLPLPNFKGIHFRFRENFWQYFVPVNKVLKAFHHLIALKQAEK